MLRYVQTNIQKPINNSEYYNDACAYTYMFVFGITVSMEVSIICSQKMRLHRNFNISQIYIFCFLVNIYFIYFSNVQEISRYLFHVKKIQHFYKFRDVIKVSVSVIFQVDLFSRRHLRYQFLP